MQVETDMVIFALGESPDLTVLPRGIETDRTHVIVDPETFATKLPSVFSAGAAVSGPGIVVEAIASGKKAALWVSCPRAAVCLRMSSATLGTMGLKSAMG